MEREYPTDRDEAERMYACWLYSAPGIGSRSVQKLQALCPEMREICRAGERLWERALTGRQTERLKDFARKVTPEAWWESVREKGIGFVTLSDEEYPKRLKEIPDPPYGLFVKGRLPDGDCPSVAVVGARECSEYGGFVAGEIGKSLGESGVQVISGMARGIDGICQQAALKAGGASFGVLGCGVDICYPASNRKLYESLCCAGGLLSAYPPGTEARPQHFPPRNRIVSGLADALIVVEARSRSGTLITVDMALEQGREVYAVPGRVTDRLSDGCNCLIRQGAGVFLTPEDFLRGLEESWKGAGGFRGRKEQEQAQRTEASPAPGELRGALKLSPQSVEQILAGLAVERTLPELTAELMALCVSGIARQVSPGRFALNPDHPGEERFPTGEL